MTDEQLISRLHNFYDMLEEEGFYTKANTASHAADRLEALVKDKRWIIEERDRTFALMLGRAEAAEARAERLEEALIWCSGSADFNEGGIAREGWLKMCAPLLDTALTQKDQADE